MKNIFKLTASIAALNLITVAAIAENTNGSAKSGQILQVVGAAANTYVGYTYAKECPSSPVSCAMSALSFAQAATSAAGALQSGKTKSASDCTGQYCNGVDVSGSLNPNFNSPESATGVLPEDTKNILGKIQDDIGKGVDSLASKGVSYDPATNSVSTPGGNISASSLSSPSGLKGLGMSDADIAKMDDIGKAALKEAYKLVDGFDMDSGGGGKKGKAGPGYENAGKDFDMNRYLASLMNNKGESPGVAGLEKKYGTDHIGVAQDNIFTMIKRRYEAAKPSLTP